VFTLFPRLSERLQQKAGSLSGGEQQMLAIGRALMAAPKLLLVDEVSLGLMPRIIDVCYAALETLRSEGVTIVLVEQSTERVLNFADRLCVLESGKFVWQGTSAQAGNDSDIVNAYLGLQSEPA
ncbi:MAG: ATP-binding cassette domain-containing protein, partial [Gammaproteobacteria bacterium]